LASNRIELLRQFESIFKTALAHESGDPGVRLKKKTEGQKSREAVPSNIVEDTYMYSSQQVRNGCKVERNHCAFWGFKSQISNVPKSE
jgi:hypothetical protein